MIAWQLRLMVLIKSANSLSSDKIAKDSGMSPYPVRKAAGLAGKLSDEQLHSMVSEALEIDIKSKTTPLDLDEALKTYIVSL
ncbi:hypothetical protein HYS85_01980 [Candidatus Saccharibacteria bacterium]|nr:hypothetical protein [Candidatus Saccharibacteria bacterium]